MLRLGPAGRSRSQQRCDPILAEVHGGVRPTFNPSIAHWYFIVCIPPTSAPPVPLLLFQLLTQGRKPSLPRSLAAPLLRLVAPVQQPPSRIPTQCAATWVVLELQHSSNMNLAKRTAQAWQVVSRLRACNRVHISACSFKEGVSHLSGAWISSPASVEGIGSAAAHAGECSRAVQRPPYSCKTTCAACRRALKGVCPTPPVYK